MPSLGVRWSSVAWTPTPSACLVAACLMALGGCRSEGEGSGGGGSVTDGDGDGFASAADGGEDCDDTREDVFPGATEDCDTVDNDCDGEIDEGLTSSWSLDADGDGYGDPDTTTEACGAPEGYVTDASDCDDGRPGVNPGAVESCDFVDNDCDGEIDEEVETTWYLDQDGDGWGDEAVATGGCDQPAEFVDRDGDCDDLDAAVHPEATEVCDEADTDEDCSGLADDEDPGVDVDTFASWYLDADGDGAYHSVAAVLSCDDPSSAGAAYTSTEPTSDSADCDDGDPLRYPLADEVCDVDDRDEDCDGLSDDDDDSLEASTRTAWYEDDDADGYGDAASSVVERCDDPSSGDQAYVADATDCDDTDADVNPSAAEVCDPDDVDEDCSGAADDEDGGVDSSTWTDWYPDGDGDGWFSPTSTVSQCNDPSDPSTSYSASAPAAADEDCDDSDPLQHPETAWYGDVDGDGYPVDEPDPVQCADPSTGSVSYTYTLPDAADVDCDDGDPNVNPGETEVCDADDTDEDCSGAAEDADPGLDTSTRSSWYADADADGAYTSSSTPACDDPSDADTTYSGSAPTSEEADCDDADDTAYPGAVEDYSDGVDNDCDGNTDETWLESDDAGLLLSGSSDWEVGKGVAVGDWDGDGQDDLALGAVEGGTWGEGEAWILLGPLSGGSGTAASRADIVLEADQDRDSEAFGGQLALTEDLDGDGYAELLVADPLFGSGARGRIYRFTGALTGTLGLSDASLSVENQGTGLGLLAYFSLSAADDLDGDGVGEVLFTRFYATSSVPSAYIFAGTTTGSLTPEDADLTLTCGSVTCLGARAEGRSDVDGDGQADLVYAAGSAVSAYTFLGPITGDLLETDADWSGSLSSGTYVDLAVGDLDQDGLPDVALGSGHNDYAATDGGAVYVFSGVSSGSASASDASFVLYGDSEDASLGGLYGEVQVADLDGDGWLDLLAGAPVEATYASVDGHVGVAFGPLSGTMDYQDADQNFVGSETGGGLGWDLAVGELDGDGLPDIAVGAPTVGSSDAGEVAVFFGSQL